MSDTPSPLDLHPDDHLEARITAYVLGEASPFETAELESLIGKSPELKLFLNRTRTLHTLLAEAEATSNTPSGDWKLRDEKRRKLDDILGAEIATPFPKEARIRRASFRAAIGIAAILILTFIISPMFIRQRKKADLADRRFIELDVPLATAGEALSTPTRKLVSEEIDDGPAENTVPLAENGLDRSVTTLPTTPAAAAAIPQVNIGGQGRDTGPQDLKDAMTLEEDGVRAGGATEFGSEKRVDLYRDGETQTFDISDKDLAQIELKAGDTIEVPQKNWLGCGVSRDEATGALAKAGEAAPELKLPQIAQQEKKLSELQELIPAPTARAEPESLVLGLEVPAADEQMSLAGAKQQLGGEGIATNQRGSELGRRDESPAQNALSAAADNFGDGWGEGAADRPGTPQSGPEISADKPSEESGTLAQRENVERKEKENFSEGSDDSAMNEYHDELENRPKSLAMADRRRSNDEQLAFDSIPREQQLREARNYSETGQLLDENSALDPDDLRIKEELGYLDDQVRTTPALTSEVTKNIDEVRSNLYKAQGNLDLGKYDSAKKEYEETLRIDPANAAARRGMEKIANATSDYYRAADDNTRSELLMKTDQAWELSVPAELPADTIPQPEEGKKQADNDAQAIFRAAIKPEQASNPTDLFFKQNAREGADLDFNLTNNFANLPVNSEISWTDPSASIPSYRFNGNESDMTYRYAPDNSKGQPPSESNFGFPVTPATPTFFESSASSAPRDKETQIDDVRDFTSTPEYDVSQNNVDPFYDTAGILSETTKSTGGAEYEINSAYSSQYLFRGLDLSDKVKPKEKPVDLTNLSEESLATQDPFSTFSLNISDASFQLARASIEKGERPDPASIKPEQFYNAVDYGDPAPSSLEPVAAAIDQTAHPVIPGRNLVRIAIRTASTGRSAAQPLRLTLLVDQSGSMVRADRRAAMATALDQLSTLLTEKDQLTVIGFSRTPRLLADSLPGNEAGKLPDLINQTANEGGTNIEQAINLASELALRHKLDGAQNRIVLFTDGAANLGNADPDRLSKKIEALRQQGLAFDIAGIGTSDLNDRLLSDLARHGNGRYYLVGENTGDSLARQLAGAFRPAAGNVKVQVKLNPARVGNYKLVGFEKDRLKTEDFRNDSVDAAELAADEAGVAMYQIEPLPEGSGEIGEVSVRFRNMTTGEMVERTWTIPYDPSAPAFDKAAPRTQLATLSLLAAQKLQPGPLADAIDFNNLSTTIGILKNTYAEDSKAQQMLTLIDTLR